MDTDPPAPGPDDPDIESDWPEYVGVFEGTDDDGVSYRIVIGADAITITVGGVTSAAENLVYLGYEGFEFDYGGTAYCISSAGFGSAVDEIAFYPKDNIHDFVLLSRTASGTQSAWPDYIGVYVGATKEGVEYRVEISVDAVSVSIDSVPAEVTILGFDLYNGFTLLVNGTEAALYDLAFGSESPVQRLMYAAGSVMFTLGREDGGDTPDPEPPAGEWTAYLGVYEGTDKSGTVYRIEITETEVRITIDGVAATVAILGFDDEGFTLSVNGTEYYLMDASYTDPIQSVALMTTDYSFSVTLARV